MPKKSIFSYFLIYMILLAVLATLLSGGFWILNEYQSFRQISASIRDDVLLERRRQLAENVKHAVDFIQFRQEQTDARLRALLKERVEHAHEIATNIYNNNQHRFTDAQLQDMIVETLRSIRFSDGRGYHFIVGMDGLNHLFPIDASVEGINLLQRHDKRSEVIQGMIDLVKQQQGGFYRYDWAKPDEQNYSHSKLSYILYFEPFDWFMGSGEYLKDYQQESWEETLAWLREVRFGKERYLFVGSYDGTSLAGPAQGRNMLESNNVEAARLFRKLIHMAKNGGGFTEYTIPALDGQAPQRKLSYVCGVDDWDWYVGTGINLQEVEASVAVLREQHYQRSKAAVLKILGIMLALILISILLAISFSKQNQRLFEQFSVFFRQAAEGGKGLRVQGGGVKEFEDLADGANRMLEQREEAELLLRKDEERLRGALEAVSDGVWEWNLRTGEAFLSERTCEMFGFGEEDKVLDGEIVFGRIHPDDSDRVQQALQSTLQGRADTYREEFRCIRPDGSIRWILGRGRVVTRDSDNAPLRIMGTNTDITSMKEMEATRAKAEETLNRVFDLLPLGIWIFGTDYRPVRFNQAGVDIWQGDGTLDMTKLRTLRVWSVPDGRLLEEKDRAIHKALEKGVTTRDELLEIETLQGQRKIVINHCSPLRGTDGAIEGAVVVQLDVTDLMRTRKALERLSQAIEQASETVVIASPDGTIEYVNPAFEKITGFRPEEAIGQNIDITKSDEHEEAFHREVWETISSGKIWSGRFVNRRKDGTLYTEEGTITPIKDANGRITNYVAVKRDVTQEINMEMQYRQAQKMEAVGQLTGGVAHDFNNLLQVINGCADLALEELPEDHPARSYMEDVAQAGGRAARLISQLLLFSRRQIMRPTVQDLNQTVEEMLKMVGRFIGEHIQLNWKPARDLPRIKADHSMVEQALMNLCINAHDAMPEGGCITIETEEVEIDEEYCTTHAWAEPGCFVCLTVSDTGCGMDSQTCEKIFEPFFSTKPAGKGTGLGLSTVYGIIKQHDGMISVYSEPDKGTVFRLYWPTSAEAAQKNAVLETQALQGGTETILVAEDDDLVRALTENILTRAGYTVLLAKDGQEGVEIFEKEKDRIDLVLLDVVMPRMGGHRASEAILRIQPDARILFASGYNEEAIHTNFVLQEGFELIQKPFTMRALLEKVRHRLETRYA